MKKNKFSLRVVGRTTDGRGIMGGVFKMSDTYGVPLEITLEYLRSHNQIVAWDVFVKDAIKAGWKPKKILTTIEAGLVDSDTPRDDIKIILEKAKIVLDTLK